MTELKKTPEIPKITSIGEACTIVSILEKKALEHLLAHPSNTFNKDLINNWFAVNKEIADIFESGWNRVVHKINERVKDSITIDDGLVLGADVVIDAIKKAKQKYQDLNCLLYTSPSPRD